MPAPTLSRRPARPTEGFSTTHLRSHPDRPMRLFLPTDYQPKYTYPLVVLFHADGTDEDVGGRLAPLLSRRNYIIACPRGSVRLGPGATGQPRFAWGNSFADGYLSSVVAHVCDEYHIHPQRLYFVGIGEGAAVAYRFALSLPGAVAGVVALNGDLPTERRKGTHGLRVFVGHGVSNPVVPVSVARRSARRLAAIAADVRFQTYPTTDGVNADMLRDVNRWIMSAVETVPELIPNGSKPADYAGA